MTWYQTIQLESCHSPWRVALAAALAFAATSTAAATGPAQVAGVGLAFAIIPLGVIVHSIARLGSFKIWALLDVGEDILTAIIRGDEAKSLFLEELLDGPSRRHCHQTMRVMRYQAKRVA